MSSCPVLERCRHCGKNQASPGRRGLCQHCHRVPSIRRRYPFVVGLRRVRGCRGAKGQLVPSGGYGEGSSRGYTRPAPAEATQAEPGSAEKVRILAARRAAGAQLWHPDDVRPITALVALDEDEAGREAEQEARAHAAAIRARYLQERLRTLRVVVG
jgi:hypothetical protein